MALMRVLIDKRTLAGLTTLDNVTYAHGLGGVPDAVFIRYIVSGATASNWFGANVVVNATNVTINNPGDVTMLNFEAVAIRFHSIIQ